MIDVNKKVNIIDLNVFLRYVYTLFYLNFPLMGAGGLYLHYTPNLIKYCKININK